MNVLYLSHLPILEQLEIEEALLRADNQEWCLINSGSPPAIILGISAKPEDHLNLSLVKKHGVPVIKRFSGGGTVYVDEQTLFVTFIRNHETPFPRQILSWSEEIYRPLFASLPFEVKENDYVFGDKKFGGNAQYIKKGRFLHHSSFLWDFCAKKMNYLLLPKRRPKYRGDRPHGEFLCKLKDYFPSKEELLCSLKKELANHFLISEVSLPEITPILTAPHRKATALYE